MKIDVKRGVEMPAETGVAGFTLAPGLIGRCPTRAFIAAKALKAN